MLTWLLLVSLLGSVAPADKKDTPLTVCDVLAKLNTYRGQRISVRGELLSTADGRWLVGRGCRPLVTDGYRWPQPVSIVLTLPEGASKESVRVEDVDEGLRRLAGPDAKTFVTVTGRLDAKEHYEMAPRGDGKSAPAGYGHLNASPAQILYEDLKDFQVEKTKK